MSTHVQPSSGPPRIRSSSSFAKTIAGRSASSRSRNRAGPKSRIALQDERSTLTRGASAGRAERRLVDRRAQERVAGQVQVRAAVEPGRVELAGRELGRDAAVGGHRPAPVRRDQRDDGAGAARDGRPANLDAVALERRAAAIPPASSSARLPTNRASPPSSATQAATFAACPPGPSRVTASASAPSASGCESRTITSRSRSPSVTIIAYHPSMDRGVTPLANSARSSSAPPSAPRPRSRPPAGSGRKERKRETPAGLAAFEEAPCYRELVERERDAP